MPDIEKLFQLKQVYYKRGKSSAFVPQPLHELLQTIANSSGNAGGCHYPDLPLDPQSPPNLCCAIDKFTQGVLVPTGIGFRLTSYRPRLEPELMAPTFTKRNLEIQRQGIKDGNGNDLELVGTAYAIAFGQILIVESSRGAGGINAMERCLGHLLTKYCAPEGRKTHPYPHLIDVADHGLLQALKRNGGAAAVVMRLAQARADSKNRFAKQATDIKKEIGKTQLVTIKHEAAKGARLKNDDVIDAFDAASDEEIDGIQVHFRLGGKAMTAKDFKIQRRSKFADLGGGRVDEKKLWGAMSTYLLKLMETKSGQPKIVDENGLLTRAADQN